MAAPRRRPTARTAVARGLLAGAAGTAAMTAWQELAMRLSQGGGQERDGDGAPDQVGPEPIEAAAWEQAPAPAQVARRIAERVFRTHLPAASIPAATHVMHWTYGTAWGGLYGLLRRGRHTGGVREGLAFGTAVWSASYAQLVPVGLYEPPWRYPPRDVALELSYHLAYGAAAAVAYRALEP